ncbi:MAG TPA: efflux RND transporter periplasmic adaptor subunit [Gammaproteobacteria bacterium]|nr:efflux RND transporter periplasmic adaptor subunit [Gammaproteobacteria bacterium]
MDQRSSLLEQLRIERPEEVASGRRPAVWWSIGLAAVAAAGVATWVVAMPRGVPITVATAEPAPADVAAAPASILDASGYVVARRQATVSAKITGKVVAVSIEEGQRVERNDVIARLDDTNAQAAVAQARAELEQSKANLAAAEVALTNAGPTFRRNEQQLMRAVISAQSFDTAKTAYDASRTSRDVAARAVEVAAARLAVAQRNLDDTIVRAPFAGVVTVKAAQEGEMVSPISAGGGFTRTGIGTIVDMSSLEVEVDVSENFINRVRADQPATVTLNAYPDWSIPARVIAIVPTAERAKATVKVRVALDVDDPRILPEMGARVAFLAAAGAAAAGAPAAQRALLVPDTAVQRNGDTGVVFVVADRSVEKRTVRLGERNAAGQIVLSGLTPGTRVAIGDFEKLRDGAAVRIDH